MELFVDDVPYKCEFTTIIYEGRIVRIIENYANNEVKSGWEILNNMYFGRICDAKYEFVIGSLNFVKNGGLRAVAVVVPNNTEKFKLRDRLWENSTLKKYNTVVETYFRNQWVICFIQEGLCRKSLELYQLVN